MKRDDGYDEEEIRLSEAVKMTWLGHATFLVETAQGRNIVIDPWLEGNPKCPTAYQQWSKADLILISHGHFDHMGSAAELAKRSGGQVVANFEIGSYLESQGVTKVVGMNKGGTLAFEGIQVTMVHADHSSGISTEIGTVYGGEAAGFVVTLENGLTFYHAGDTNVFGDMGMIHDLYGPEVAMLPIGGHFTMAPKEAAYAARLLQVGTVIPMHYGTFPALSGSPAALSDLLQGGDIHVVSLEPGQSWSE
ncbi:MAG: metal-dependent hydrolase [Firmicutes bacterium]|nr:metal-dependent hydrolase [Bacillota bacterium]